MANVNIRRDVDDQFYRYKMPRLIAKVEGRGNGIKTVIPNMTEIAKCLSRPPAYPTKFFGSELGSLTTCDSKFDRYVVNGAHSQERLAEILDSFIEKFVLCGSCKNPETELVIKKGGDILRDCKACGAHEPVDLRHKLVKYILTNPPGGSTVKTSKKSKKNKNKEEGKGAVPTPPETASANASDEDGSDEALTKKITEEAKNLNLVSRLGDDDWAEDMSADAIAKRQKELAPGGAVAKMEEEDGGGENVFDEFAEVLSELDVKATSGEEIKYEAIRLGLSDEDAVVVLVQVLFPEGMILDRITEMAGLFKVFLTSKKSQKKLLGGMERVLESKKEQLSDIPRFLKAWYDEDVVEEEAFIEWFTKHDKKIVGKKWAKEVRSKAEVFINWLKEAEEESEEED